jgi:branched-subunit amino acid ABC-type transport system permease component
MALAFGLDVYPVREYTRSSPYKIGDVPVRPIYIAMFIVTVIIVVGVEMFVRRSRSGLYLRMTFEDPEGAGLQGTSIVKVVLISFAVAGAVAAIGGALIVPVTSASSQLAASFGLFGFAGMAIGGYGSFMGALVGGLFVGIVNSLVPVWLNVDLAPAIVYVVLIAVLVLRPQGLFGKSGAFGASKVREV